MKHSIMPLKEFKSCPRCNKKFECDPGNIEQCQCYGIVLSAEEIAWMEEKYKNCLCSNCLRQISTELAFFKEKYIFR